MHHLSLPVFILNSCDSTMDIARNLLNKDPWAHCSSPFFCVTTRYQAKGRGRGSVWTHGLPSLPSLSSDHDQVVDHQLSYVDFSAMEPDFWPVTFVIPLDRVAVPLEWVTSLVGCAVLDSLKDCHRELSLNNDLPSMCLKWPNDVIVWPEGEKLGGILCEMLASRSLLLIGLGLNLCQAPSLPKVRSFLSLLPCSVQKSELVPQFARSFWPCLFRYLTEEKSSEIIRRMVMERSVPLGALLSVDKGRFTGRFAGLQKDGALLLEESAEPIYSAEVSLL